MTVSLSRAELERRAVEAHELLGERCVVSPRGCKVDRLADIAGLCAIGRHAVVASYFRHFGEEDCLRGRRGSGTIFSGCTGVTASGGNSFAGSESGVTKTLLSVGSYSVSEPAVLGYALKSLSVDCAGVIALGEHKTCTVTNDDIPS